MVILENIYVEAD